MAASTQVPDIGRLSLSHSPSSTSLTSSPHITVTVSERTFTTLRDTLTSQSTYFRSLLSDRWASNALPDGSIFVDADPVLFEHVLRYLRRGVFPLFWDADRGYDYGLYASLLQEARYFGIDDLIDWLEQKRYLEAVGIRRTMNLRVGENTPLHVHQSHDETESANKEIEYQCKWGIKKIYVCPRNIAVHRGKPEACGQQCQIARAGGEYQYDEEPRLSMVIMTRELVFKPEVLLP